MLMWVLVVLRWWVAIGFKPGVRALHQHASRLGLLPSPSLSYFFFLPLSQSRALRVTLAEGVTDGPYTLRGEFGPEYSIAPWYYLAGCTSTCTAIGRYSGTSLVAVGRVELPTHAVVFAGTPTLPVHVWRSIAARAGVHLYAGGGNDAVVEVMGGSLYIAQAADHWSPWTQRTVTRTVTVAVGGVESPTADVHAGVGGGWNESTIAGCRVRLPMPSRRVEELVAGGHSGRARVLVCTDCSTWTQPCNSSALYTVV
jgi:hypothetical protein